MRSGLLMMFLPALVLGLAALAAASACGYANEANPFAEEPADPEGITRRPPDENPNGGASETVAALSQKDASAKNGESKNGGNGHGASGDSTANAAALVEALSDWIHLMEYNDLKTAQARYGRDPKAIKELAELWPALIRTHKKFNYRDWLTGERGRANASAVGDGTRFRVGGCRDAGCLHTHWEKTPAGWRIIHIVQCD